MCPVSAGEVDLSRFIRPGDRVIIGQGTAQPQTLVRLLIEQQERFPGMTLFVGPSFTDIFSKDAARHLRFESYGALGKTAQLALEGRLDILPMGYGELCAAFASGEQRADVVMMAGSPRADGSYGAGISHDYAYAASAKARAVILEVNNRIPWTFGDAPLDNLPITLCVESREPLPGIPASKMSPIERRVAAKVAELVPEGGTIQMGMGAVPAAVMSGLAGHRDLGLHTGVMSDEAVDLIQAGVITNARKELDTGISVANALFGSRQLYDFVRERSSVEIRPAHYTHSLEVLAQIGSFTAINGCTEVDLGGQVNTETANGRYVGALGGMLEFARGARRSVGGRSIIALRSTTGSGSVSRIVPRVDTATLPRADADTVVTENGVAELRGFSLRERARRLIAIADSAFQEDLERAAHSLFGGRNG